MRFARRDSSSPSAPQNDRREGFSATCRLRQVLFPTQNSFFNRVAVVGLGLMGGSWGLALRKRGFPGTLVGCDRPEVLSRALAARAMDEGAEDPAKAARDADLVILAAPVGAILDLVP